tara:strand:+ start:784 stop:1227 length:444 start_codon:yes stop_codon:yes gene_type:complete
MADLLTTTERQNISGIIDDVFDTFKRAIVVYKEPTKTVSDVDLDFMFGYNAESQSSNYIYTQVTGSYHATVKYIKGTSPDETSQLLNSELEDQLVRIKVNRQARDFIENGANQKCLFDDKDFEFISNDTPKIFLGNTYYYYFLKETR